MGDLVWVLDTWETPATHYEERQIGNYRLKKSEYVEGFYKHYCMDGYVATQVIKPIPIMLLQEYREGVWHDWMADDPMDYRAIQKYAEASSGDVLTAGLGLGLVVHELKRNPRVNSITVVEISPEVVGLAGDYIPKEKTTLIQGDFWDFVREDKTEWDMIIVDIWATKGKEQHERIFQEEVLPAYNYLHGKYPDSKFVFHGFTQITDVELVQSFFARSR